MDRKNIETIYPLTPLQQAFLWHSLQTSVKDGLIHMCCTLRGDLDSGLLQQAWQFVVRQHPALRTSVHWENVKQPLQVVARQAPIPWLYLDWRGQALQPAALADFLEAERDRSFDLTQAPISRLALIRLNGTDYELIWSCHHLMLDGWSGALVFNQVFDCYDSLRQGQSPAMETGPSYQSYGRWLKQQVGTAAEACWREALAGIVVPGTVLGSEAGAAADTTQNLSSTVKLSSEMTAGVQAFLRSHRLTLNTLMQGIWALLLYSYSGQSDILFGATVSGRQGELAGIESIVGLLINVVPVRIQVQPQQRLLDWLGTLQVQQAKASRYAYASPDQIQRWSQVPGRLFNSLLVIENYPIQTGSNRSLQVDNMQSGLVSTYDLTVIVKPGETLRILLQANKPVSQTLTGLLNQFRDILTAIVEQPERPIGRILFVQAAQQPMSAPEAADLSRARLEGRFFAPVNPMELKLTQIWELVLGVSPLSVEESFFDVGGNSLLAVQLFNQMQQQLDCTLPLATLFQAPNVRRFSALLGQPVAKWSSLVPIQTSGARRPFFFHGGSADALTWAQFSHLLGTDRPFYALQRPDLDGSEVTHTTVEALAADSIKEMRMVQPKGPYLVGGHCLGGAVAFEIAQQLQAEGEAVTSVVLIDAYRPGALPETLLTKLQSRLHLSALWPRKIYSYHGGWENLLLLPGKIWQKLIPAGAPHGSAREPANADGSIASLSEPKIPYEYRYARAQKANELAADRYEPQPYGGQVKLFRAEIQIFDWYFGQELGWQTVTKAGVKLTKIPGFFGNLFNQRSLPLLTAQVREYLSTLE